jgi:hypothetical protein
LSKVVRGGLKKGFQRELEKTAANIGARGVVMAFKVSVVMAFKVSKAFEEVGKGCTAQLAARPFRRA